MNTLNQLFFPLKKAILTSLRDLNMTEVADAQHTVFIQLENAMGGIHDINRNKR